MSHHHHHHQHANNPSSPMLLSLLRLLLHCIPFPLLIAALVLQILSCTSNAWSEQGRFSTAGDKSWIGNSTAGLCASCPLVTKPGANPDSSNPNDFQPGCYSMADFCSDPSRAGDLAYLCEQLGVARRLMVSGTVFTGVAMLSALALVVVALASLRAHRKHYASNALLFLLRAFSILSLALTGLATLIGTQQLLNNQPDDGNFINTEGAADLGSTHWMLGRGSWLAFSGWICVLVEAALLPGMNDFDPLEP